MTILTGRGEGGAEAPPVELGDADRGPEGPLYLDREGAHPAFLAGQKTYLIADFALVADTSFDSRQLWPEPRGH